MDIIINHVMETYDIDYKLNGNTIIIDYKDLTFKVNTYNSLIQNQIKTIDKVSFTSIPKKFIDKIEKNYLMIYFNEPILVDEKYILNILIFLENTFYKDQHIW